MTISSRFAVGIHILTLLELNKEINTSETIAGSVNTNPAVIRKIIGMLKKPISLKSTLGKLGLNLKKA